MIVSVRCSEQWQRSNGVPDVPVCRRSCFTHVSSTFDRFSTILTNKLIFSRCRVRIFHPTSVIRRFLSPRIMYRVACNEYRDLWGQVSRTIEQISGGVVIAAAAAAAAAVILPLPSKDWEWWMEITRVVLIFRSISRSWDHEIVRYYFIPFR